jgi:hypothetical protein
MGNCGVIQINVAETGYYSVPACVFPGDKTFYEPNFEFMSPTD